MDGHLHELNLRSLPISLVRLDSMWSGHGMTGHYIKWTDEHVNLKPGSYEARTRDSILVLSTLICFQA